MAIARRLGYGKKVLVGDKKLENAKSIAKIMNDVGYDVTPVEMDLSSRASIQKMIAQAQQMGEITMMVNAAGVSPSQVPIQAILKVDLYGTAVLLEEVGKVIAPGGVGVTISSQSGHRMPALTPEEDERLACTPAEHLLEPLLQPENIRDTLHAYQLAKRCNEKRVMAAGRPGTADEVANVAELLMGDKGAFITGADFLIDGGATASYFYGPLRP